MNYLNDYNKMNYDTGGKSGLVNLGNTCFMNTCIQCLGHITVLRNYILSNTFDENNQKVCYQLKRLLVGLWENDCTVNPVSFHKTIKQIAKKEKVNINFTKNIQNDINEFIIFLIEIIEKELDNDFIKTHFYGNMTTVISNLDHKEVSKTKSLFNILNVPLKSTLKECLDSLKDEELLEGDNKWYNEKTKLYQDAYKKYIYDKMPNELIVSFNRFNNLGNKLNNVIDFPVDMIIINGKKYYLKSIGNHSGNMFGGHYYAYVKHGGQWYNYNDSGVQKMNIDNLVSSNAYVLFYSLDEN